MCIAYTANVTFYEFVAGNKRCKGLDLSNLYYVPMKSISFLTRQQTYTLLYEASSRMLIKSQRPFIHSHSDNGEPHHIICIINHSINYAKTLCHCVSAKGISYSPIPICPSEEDHLDDRDETKRNSDSGPETKQTPIQSESCAKADRHRNGVV